jgi:Domain of unknown function (DUF4158)
MPRIPEEVRSFVAGQLGLLWDCSEAYSWQGSTRDYHPAQIRQQTGWRFSTTQDKDDLEHWLRTQGAMEAHTADALFDSHSRHRAFEGRVWDSVMRSMPIIFRRSTTPHAISCRKVNDL